jgi:hypothetical protein
MLLFGANRKRRSHDYWQGGEDGIDLATSIFHINKMEIQHSNAVQNNSAANINKNITALRIITDLPLYSCHRYHSASKVREYLILYILHASATFSLHVQKFYNSLARTDEIVNYYLCPFEPSSTGYKVLNRLVYWTHSTISFSI